MLAAFAADATAVPAEIPFRLERHNIVVEVQIKAGPRLLFAFDSGLSSGNLITVQAAQSLGIKADRDMGVRDAGGERSAAQETTLPDVRIGGVALANVPFAVTDIPAQVIQRPGGGSLAGFVGAPLLRDAVLCIDYRRRRLLRWSRADFDDAGLVSIPLKLNHGLPTVDIGIDGRRAGLIVDSGADAAITVYAAFAEANDFGHRYPALRRQSANGGSGQNFEAVMTQAQTVDLGPGAAFSNVPLQVMAQGMNPAWGIDGMIGYPVLRQLNPCIDTGGGRLLYRGE